MRKGTPILRWLIVAAVTLCWFTGLAAAGDTSYRTKNMEAWNYLDQAAGERAATDPMFKKALTEIQNQTKAMAAGANAKVAQPAKVNPIAVPKAYVYPWPPNVAPPWFNPGLGFNPAVNYDVPNYNQSPNIRKFINKLPGLGTATCTVSVVPGTGTCNENELGQYIPVAMPDTTSFPGADYYEITANNYSTKMNTDLPATALRGYAQTNATDPAINNVYQYLGPLILARVYDPSKPAGVAGNGKPVRMKFTNALPISTNPLSKLGLPVDTTIMGAGMGPTAGVSYTENRISIPHLHGGRTPWISDGTPHQWVTPANDPTIYKKGASFQNVPDMVTNGTSPCAGVAGKCITPTTSDGKATLYWTNQQSARLMFYHDHAYGITRLNVYKGVAAGYLLVDQVEDDLIDGTNISGGNPAATQILPNLGSLGGAYAIYRYGIPLVVQDKNFVNDGTTNPDPSFPGAYAQSLKTADADPLWATYAGTPGGSLWISHEYMPVENIFDTVGGVYPDGSTWPAGNTTNGRWDYGPFLIPPMVPTTSLILPSPTMTPESFGDTAIVNGTAFPYISLPAEALRFRILSVGNDRVFNLQWYYAKDASGNICKAGGPAFNAATCTEVSMVPAVPQPPPYQSWPKDGRDGGVPDPTTHGPSWYLIGNEGGLLAKVTELPAQPVDYNYNRQIIPLANVTSASLIMLPAMRADVVVDFSSATAGDVLILYNDAPAPMSGFWPINDYYTDCPDQRPWGGPTPTAPGFGPNTRTVMQVRIIPKATAFVFSANALKTAIPQAFAVAQEKPFVPQKVYNAAFPGFATTDMYVQAPDGTLNLTGTGQGISKIMTVMPGNGYVTAPTVRIIGDGTGAAATAGLNPNGGITLLTTGTGYTTAPTVTIGAPAAGGVRATAVATVSGGQVQAISITEPGSNYSTVTAATCAIAGGGGTGATCSTFVATAGTVGSITVTAPGSGYTRQPRIYLMGGGGMNAAADALLTGAIVMTTKSITEGFDPEYGRLDIRLGSTPNPLTPNVGAGFVLGIARYIDPPTEIVNNEEVTAWRLTHLGVDSHALHFHLFDVQVVNRVDWTNVVKPPYPDELGWRDTIRTNPMEDIVVVFRPHQAFLPFQLPKSNRLLDVTTPLGSTASFYPVPPPVGVPAVAQQSNVMTNFGFEYVWHCHMLSHEENDFMRALVFNVPVPAAPVLTFTVTGPPTAVTLNWTSTSAAGTTFTLQRATNTGFTTGLVSHQILNAKTYTDSTVTANARYYYRVQAKNQGGTSAWSNVATVITVAAPTGLTPSVITRNGVTLTWVNSATGTGVAIQRATNAAFTTGLVTTNLTPGTLTTRAITGLTPNRTYWFRVATRTALGNGAWSNVVSITTLP
jgi:FtsP/CotA-like multicopper oxidase with cupredoxin domain